MVALGSVVLMCSNVDIISGWNSACFIICLFLPSIACSPSLYFIYFQDSNFLDDTNTMLLHPATVSDTLHSPLGSSQLSPVSSLTSFSHGQLSSSSSTSRIPVRTNPRSSLPLASYNLRTVVHPAPYDAVPFTTPSGLASHNSTSQSLPQSHLPAPTSAPSVMYRLPESDHGDRLQALAQTARKLKERITYEMELRGVTENVDSHFNPTSLPPKNPSPLPTSLPPKNPSSLPSDRAPVRRNLMVKMATTASPRELPGVGSMREHAEVARKRSEEEAAAAKIQAAFRGYRVRRGMGGRGWLHAGRLGVVGVAPVATAARVSPTLSPRGGLGTPSTVPARGAVTCSNLGTLPLSPQATPTKAQPAGPVLRATSPPSNLPWQHPPAGDTYSVINVFNRQQEKLRETLGIRGASSPLSSQQRPPKSPTHASSPLPNGSHYSYTASFEQQSLQSDGDPSCTVQAVTPPRVTISQSPYASNRSSPVLHSDPATPRQTTPTDTPTLRKDVASHRHEGASRAEGPEEGGDGSPSPISSLAKSPPTTPVSSLTKSPPTTDERTTASSRTEPTHRSSETSPGAVQGGASPEGGRLSPRSLQLKLQTELNLLESVEESMRCLSNVDETRAVAVAQSKTATLAQLLASEKQLRAREVEALHVVAKTEEDRRREEEWRGREELRELAQDARRLQEEAARKADEHVAKLDKIQEDSSRVAREIERHMAEVHSAATVAMAEVTRQQMKAAQDMAASVAVAATKEAVRAALGRLGPQKTPPSSSESLQRSSPLLSQLSARRPSCEHNSNVERSSTSLQPSRKDLSTHTHTIRTEGAGDLQSQGTSHPPSTELETDRTLQSQIGTSRPPSTEPEANRTLQSQAGTSRSPSTEPEANRTLQSQTRTSRPPSTEPEAQTGTSRPSSTEPEANRTLQSQAGTSRPPSTEPEAGRVRQSRGEGHTSPSPSVVDTDVEDGKRLGETEEVEEEEEELGGGKTSVATKEIDQVSCGRVESGVL